MRPQGCAGPPLAALPRLASQRNLVSLQDGPLVHELQGVFFLVDDDAIGTRESVDGGGR
jgi:hypothetical protein